MQEPGTDSPSADELAECVAELPEWDQLLVRDYYDQLAAEALDSRPPRSQEQAIHDSSTSPAEGVVISMFGRPGGRSGPPLGGEAA